MRSLSGSSITTFLMFVPLLAVPLLAIFGIPEFSPVNASPSGDEHRVLDVSDRSPVGGRSEKHSPEDLFAEVEKRTEFSNDFKRLDVERRENPFRSGGTGQPAAKSDEDPSAMARRERLQGWKVDRNRHGAVNSLSPSPASPREPNPTTSGRDDRNPFGGSKQSEPAPSERLERPKSFADYEQSRAEEAARKQAIRKNGIPAVPATPKPDHRGTTLALNTQSAAGGQLTWRSAVARLNKLGIHDFRLVPGRRSGEFHFSCTFTPHKGTRVMHRFEAEDTEPLKAVGHVLAQIETWLRRR